MTLPRKIATALLLATVSTVAISAPALADPRDDHIKALEQKLDALAGELRALREEQASDKADQRAVTSQIVDLKRGQAAQLVDAQAQRAADPKFTLNNGRPTFSTADGSSTLAIRSLLQYDLTYFSQKGRGASLTDLSSGTNFRRARIGVDGKLFTNWSYSFIYDLGGSGTEGAKVSDAFIQYDGLAPFHIRTGSFVSPQGIEDQTGTGELLFLERAGPTDLARSIAGADGRKNFLNIFAQGDDYYASVAWSAARAADPLTFDSQQALVGRLSGRLFKDGDTNIVVSANGTYVFKIADTAAGPAGPSAITFQEGPENTVDGTRLISTGGINAHRANILGLETAANHKNFYVQGGYFRYGIARRASTLPNPDFNGWYAQASWVLTGETRGYNAATSTFGAPRAAKPFNFNGDGIGAWELTGRYSVVDLNYNQGVAGSAVAAALGAIRGGRQEGLTVGINWYPNNVVRFLADYQHLNIDRLAATAPFQDIGQQVDVFTARAQLAF